MMEYLQPWSGWVAAALSWAGAWVSSHWPWLLVGGIIGLGLLVRFLLEVAKVHTQIREAIREAIKDISP